MNKNRTFSSKISKAVWNPKQNNSININKLKKRRRKIRKVESRNLFNQIYMNDKPDQGTKWFIYWMLIGKENILQNFQLFILIVRREIQVFPIPFLTAGQKDKDYRIAWLQKKVDNQHFCVPVRYKSAMFCCVLEQ